MAQIKKRKKVAFFLAYSNFMRSFVVELVIDNIASDFYYKVLLLYE